MIQLRILFLFLLLGLGICKTLSANKSNDYKFNRIDVERGLSNSEVLCIFKDRSGFMWFGTPSGLNRYDGYEVVSCKQDLSADSHLFSNNDIWRIQEDAEGRLWLNTRLGYAIYDPGRERFVDSPSDLFKKYAGTEDFWSVYIDEGKNFWFVTWEDVRFFDIKTGKLKIFEQGVPDGLSRGLIADIKQGKNRYWFFLDNGMLECLDAQTYKVISRDSTILKLSKTAVMDQREMTLFIDSSGDVWAYGIGSHFGVAHYSTSHTTWRTYSADASLPYRITNNVITGIQEDNNGNIWIATDHGGVNVINKKTGEISVIKNDENDPLSLVQNTVKSLYKDDTGIMWLGTYKKGICYYHESIYKFKSLISSSTIPYKDINCFLETKEGNFWIGTNGGGLLFFNRKKEEYTVYKRNPQNPNSPAGDVIVGLEEDMYGRLWIGYYLEGLDCFDGNSFTNYNYDPQNTVGLTDNNAWTLRNDENGNLWIGTLRGGVLLMDVVNRKIIRHLETNGSVYALIRRRLGGMFVGAQSGLYLYDFEKEILEPYEPEVFDKIQLSRNDINYLCEDSRGLLWIGTRNGLFVYNPYTKEVNVYTEDNGLSSDLIQSVLEDSENNMWIATNRGLSCVKVTTNVETPGYFFNIMNYDSSEGLQGELFNYNAAYITSRSELLFGGISGFNLFVPSQISYNTNSPKVVITDFQIYNKRIKPEQEYNGRVLLKNSISITDEIKLKYSDNYITLTFAALDYCMPSKSRYYYKLNGFNEQWLEADRYSRKATYTNLSPGTYLFNLKAVNNDGVESLEPVSLKIIVSPPFWNTAVAWIVYLLFVLSVIWWYRRRMSIKAERKLVYAQEKLKTNQQLEMDEMKLRFFTNISHEFRTPLTLILTPLDELMNKEKDKEKKNLLAVIDRNARNLLRLVNQILDFRKLDDHAHKLQLSHGDIIQFLNEQASLFNEVMEKKRINYAFTTELSVLSMWFDADKLGKIMVNLLSNAYKFTPEGGHVSIYVKKTEDALLSISVQDDGIGIPEDAAEKIFERFYQVDPSKTYNHQGSGIGLHIVKEYVELHGGKVHAEKLPDRGSLFEIRFPIVSEVSEQSKTMLVEEGEQEEQLVSTTSATDELPKLLVVEDNTELRSFLSDQLKNDYVVLQASNGIEGKDIAFAEIPDMILSDVMMPLMNGVELCQLLKADIRTSHIPLILLTAKSGEESKLEGLTAGADDYITKPFNLDILKVKIRNVIETRRRNQKAFQQQIQIEPSKITVSSLDEKLIRKALDYTEQHMSDPDFSVEELSRELGMSRVHLYKKLSSLTGKTPIEFIRIIRLKRAAQLLQESQLTVSEIAYEVGFNNPKYFRKYFKDEFGVLPSLYGNRNE